jgi:hypothetical protein
MKKFVGATLMTAGLLLTVVGCNDSKGTNNSKEVSSEAAAIEQEETANIEDQYGPAENFLTPDEEKEGFEYVEGLGGVKPYGFGYNEQVGIDGTDAPLKPVVIGPAKLTIKNVRVVDIIPSDDSADMLEAETGGRVRSIVLDVESENTSDADISFYPDQMTITTDSGEQIEADIMLSDDVGGDFIGKVKKEGSIRFLTKNPEQDIKNITLVIDPPSSPETYENIGEQVRLDFEILDVDSSLKRDGKK